MDLNQDGTKDIVANWHGRKITVFNGLDNQILWEYSLPNSEANNSISPGCFNENGIPDLFTFFSQGMWPQNTGAHQIAFDGSTGKILYEDIMGCTEFFTPGVANLDHDKEDEVLLSINEQLYRILSGRRGSHHRLALLDIADASFREVRPPILGKNVASSPWIRGLDQGGLLNIVYCMQPNMTKIHEYFGFRIERLSTNIPIDKAPGWGGYMGNRGDGYFSYILSHCPRQGYSVSLT